MKNIADCVVEEARSWLGTPYCHQAATKGAGTDCLGLIRGVWRALYEAEPENVPAYTPDWSEASQNEELWAAGLRHLVLCPSKSPAMGNVLLFRMRDGAVAKHLGIVAKVDPVPSFIHAYTGHGVIESPLSEPWARRIVANFAFPKEIS